jgi:hypothetical protein
MNALQLAIRVFKGFQPMLARGSKPLAAENRSIEAYLHIGLGIRSINE